MPEKKSKTKQKDINPQVKSVKIGVRTLRKVPVYPLSVADQLEITDLVTDAISAFFSLQVDEKMEGPPAEFIAFMFSLIKENIGELIVKITGEEDSDEILSEITNDQMAEIIAIVYKENFEVPFVKLVGLFQTETDSKMSMESILTKLQSPSAGSTEDTGSKTSSEKVTGKED
jgi:hypothetical protein